MKNNFSKDEMIDYEQIEGDCDEIEEIYNSTVKLIKQSDQNDIHNVLMKTTLKSHEELIENRKDWEQCQKTARRKRIIAMWHNTQVLQNGSKG